MKNSVFFDDCLPCLGIGFLTGVCVVWSCYYLRKMYFRHLETNWNSARNHDAGWSRIDSPKSQNSDISL